MPDDEQKLNELMQVWTTLRKLGHDVAAIELCSERLDLLSAMEARIEAALRQSTEPHP
jgi:hypothetical protein